ncbi:MAG: PTS sugar transporter subunit IIA [bacterium]|nr:PTS sugar transporter subunit IIA [bacterium]
MQISRYLTPKLVKLEMDTVFEPPEDGEAQILTIKRIQERKEALIAECVDLLNLSGKVGNKNKLLRDLFDREKKATTAIGKGIAIPHVRTMQAKELIIAIARSTEGYDFDAADGQPVHVFVAMAAPPYDDSLYLRVFRALAQLFTYEGFYERIMTAQQPYDVIRAIQEIE